MTTRTKHQFWHALWATLAVGFTCLAIGIEVWLFARHIATPREDHLFEVVLAVVFGIIASGFLLLTEEARERLEIRQVNIET